MTYLKITNLLADAAQQNIGAEPHTLTPAQQRQQERMEKLAMSIFYAFGDVFNLYTHGAYTEASFATKCKYNHDGTMLIGFSACHYGTKGEIDEGTLSPIMDKDIESFFKFVATYCGLDDELTIDTSSELPERRIIAANPHALIDLIERMIEPFHRETVDAVGIRQTRKPNLSENYFTAFATRCIHHSMGQGNSEEATLQHFINNMPTRTYSSIYAACAHGVWASNDKRLFPVSLQKLRVWADSILSPNSEQTPELACFQIH